MKFYVKIHISKSPTPKDEFMEESLPLSMDKGNNMNATTVFEDGCSFIYSCEYQQNILSLITYILSTSKKISIHIYSFLLHLSWSIILWTSINWSLMIFLKKIIAAF